MLISTSYARALLRAVADQGHDPEQFLSRQNLQLDDIADNATMDAAAFGRLYQQAIVLLDDEAIGMVRGMPVRRGTFRMMCLSVVHCSDLATIVRRVGEFFDVCLSAGVKPITLYREGYTALGFGTVQAETRELAQILLAEEPVRIRTSLFMWHSLLCWFAGHTLPLQQVMFGFPTPPNGDQWQEIFRCPVSFDAADSMLCYDTSMLSTSNVQNEHSLSVFLKSAPYRLIVPSYHDQLTSDRVLALLGDDFTQPLPSAKAVSQQLGMSISTLRRRLQQEGTSFQVLKDDCRRVAALQYLASQDLSYAEIAGLLGFDEHSAFYRAFKRWTGTTPSGYRASLLQ